jgi:uncharacterized protein
VRGYSLRDVKELQRARKTWLDYLRGKISLERASTIVGKSQSKRWFKLAFVPRAEKLKSSHALKEMDFDATRLVGDIKVPLLFIYGGEDPWVPVKESLSRLKTIVKESPNVCYAVIPGASHEMTFKKREMMEFGDKNALNEGASEVPAYFMLMASWLQQFAASDFPART